MKRKRFTEEQIIGIPKEAEAGAKKQDLCRKHSEHTFYRWRPKYGGMQVSDAKKLKELEAENRKLKQLGPDAHLDNAALKELGTAYPRYGYELLHGTLKAEELVVNERKTYRIYREEKLQVRRKRWYQLAAEQAPLPKSCSDSCTARAVACRGIMCSPMCLVEPCRRSRERVGTREQRQSPDAHDHRANRTGAGNERDLFRPHQLAHDG